MFNYLQYKKSHSWKNKILHVLGIALILGFCSSLEFEIAGPWSHTDPSLSWWSIHFLTGGKIHYLGMGG
jgi:hypothetical protein